MMHSEVLFFAFDPYSTEEQWAAAPGGPHPDLHQCVSSKTHINLRPNLFFFC